ncbi:DUF3515 domain-containing protein [Corynebacterium sp. 335C]
MGDKVQPKGNRLGMVVALVLAVLLAAGVIGGAKIVQDNAARQPVALSSPEMPEDDNPKCAELLDRLPDRLDGLVRAPLADPAPQGAAVWRDSLDDRVTLRCGAPVPVQFTPLAETEEIGGVQWLAVGDGAPGSELTTWYSVGRTPVVAVTADADHRDDLEDISKAMGPDADAGGAPEPHALPLADLAAPHDDDRCTAFRDALPAELGEFRRLEGDAAGSVPGLVAWADGTGQLVTARCGVEEPDGYEGTDKPLTQVGEIVWFNEPAETTGVTGTYFALGRERFVAVHVPMAQASGLLPAFSDVISATLANTAPSEE